MRLALVCVALFRFERDATHCAELVVFFAPMLQSRLAYLTNKCYGEADLEYYIVEAGHILGLKLPEEADAKVGWGVCGMGCSQTQVVTSLDSERLGDCCLSQTCSPAGSMLV